MSEPTPETKRAGFGLVVAVILFPVAFTMGLIQGRDAVCGHGYAAKESRRVLPDGGLLAEGAPLDYRQSEFVTVVRCVTYGPPWGP